MTTKINFNSMFYNNLVNYIKRFVYKSYLSFQITLLWIYWYPKYFIKIKKIKRTLNFLNSEIPFFSLRFPSLNTKSFLEHCKYWIYWIKKMDSRERRVFKEWNPIILITEEDWVHLDLSKSELPIINYTFYWPDKEWVAINIFNSIQEFQHFFSVTEDTEKKITSIVKELTLSKALATSLEKKGKKVSDFNEFEKGIFQTINSIDRYLKAPKFND